MWIGLLALLTTSVIGGAISPVLVKLGVREIPPLTFTALRFLLATIIFLPFYVRYRPKNLSKKDVKVLSFYSIFFALNVGLFSIAIQFTTALMSQILYTFVPIFVGFLSHFIVKEKFTKNKIIGSVIAFLGIIFLIEQSLSTQKVVTFGTPIGNILCFCAVFSWSLYIVFSKRLTHIYSPVTTSFFSFIITASMLFLLIPFELIIRPLVVSDITIVGISSLIGAAIVSSAIMFFLKQVGIKQTTAFTMSIFSYLDPFFTSFTAVPILGEKPNFTLLFGGLLIIVGVFYATSYEHARKYLTSVLQ